MAQLGGSGSGSLMRLHMLAGVTSPEGWPGQLPCCSPRGSRQEASVPYLIGLCTGLLGCPSSVALYFPLKPVTQEREQGGRHAPSMS